MKILLISMQSESAIGGVEKYNSNLINMFNKNFIKYDLLNFSDSSSKFVNNKNKKYFMLFKKIYIEFNKKNSIIKKSLYLFYIKKYTRKIIKSINLNDYSNIIDSTYIYFKSICKDNRYTWCQHCSYDFYSGKMFNSKILNSLGKIYNILTMTRNFFINSNSIILFTSNESSKFKKNKKTKYFEVPIGIYNFNYIKSNYKNNKIQNQIAYLGRIDEKQKSLSTLVNLSDNKLKFDIYGSGPDLNLLLNNKNINYHGPYNHSDLSKIYQNIKFTILCSKYEGFPLSLVESLSHGIPIIVIDSFPAASFLTDNNKNGFLSDENNIYNNCIAALNMDDKKYDILKENCFKFAQENLSLETWEENWVNILNKIAGERK